MSRARDLLDLAAFLRWAGPWAGQAVPSAVDRVTREIPGLGRAYVYVPRGRAPAGAYLLAQGLHHQGPDDPRLDRFCRVLAASGLLVHAPFLPDFERLLLAPTLTDHLALGFDDLAPIAAAHGLRPSLFSISFGALPAAALAARPAYRDRVGALVVFGGFADFFATVRFAASGIAEHRGARVELPFDVLNIPAVFLNLIPHLGVEGDHAALADAWRAMIHRTWGRFELKRSGARDGIARDIAGGLPADLREPFLLGCGLRPGVLEAVDAALARSGHSYDFFDPRPHFAEVRAPVLILHGRDDDVIPWFQAEKIAAALAPGHPHRVLVTGMATHTGVGLPPLGALWRELVTLFATADAICDAPRRTW